LGEKKKKKKKTKTLVFFFIDLLGFLFSSLLYLNFAGFWVSLGVHHTVSLEVWKELLSNLDGGLLEQPN
jgi:hypothetical protein